MQFLAAAGWAAGPVLVMHACSSKQLTTSLMRSWSCARIARLQQQAADDILKGELEVSLPAHQFAFTPYMRP